MHGKDGGHGGGFNNSCYASNGFKIGLVENIQPTAAPLGADSAFPMG